MQRDLIPIMRANLEKLRQIGTVLQILL